MPKLLGIHCGKGFAQRIRRSDEAMASMSRTEGRGEGMDAMERGNDQGKRVTSAACHVAFSHLDGYIKHQSVGPI